MLGYIEPLARFSMNHTRPARIVFQDMAICQDFVGSNKHPGSEAHTVTVWKWNFNFVNRGFSSIWVSNRTPCKERQEKY